MRTAIITVLMIFFASAAYAGDGTNSAQQLQIKTQSQTKSQKNYQAKSQTQTQSKQMKRTQVSR